jgi:hypothetical protein
MGVGKESRTMRRAVNEMMISVGALLLLLATLVAMDDRVREQVSLRLHPGSARAEFAQAGGRVRDLADVVFQAARHQTLEHAPLTVFVIGATVLLVLMLRL